MLFLEVLLLQNAVAGLRDVNVVAVEVRILWQAQHLLNLEVQISWQGQQVCSYVCALGYVLSNVCACSHICALTCALVCPPDIWTSSSSLWISTPLDPSTSRPPSSL